ncbi:330_t:CDS:2 [Paraglomus occultum]|uniref:330_t:CDS:1 n=1 Tax=Paraglomus occultum TaxID=144539 RepID=A0A9N8W7F5_9GLOM|nr:330_t:CDS:2 [Paraglomus occultum]
MCPGYDLNIKALGRVLYSAFIVFLLHGHIVALKNCLEIVPFEAKVDGVSLKRKYESTISTGEGLDAFVIISDERLQYIDEFMTSHWVALLRSPSESGKTTLAIRLKNYLENKGRYVVNISILDLNGTRKWGMDSNEASDAYWMELVGKTWTELMNLQTQENIRKATATYICSF